ncbi:DUF6049 family protein [Georgenia subflava]|uniref:2-oxoglutarate dehydrogenase n=1 Tax=Georgenia subflava TaxID=1622177 RepID=A0A6N7EBM8_9MICO|nr:DUF6049 family protein [Georgenia subflava]MPV35812.1 hypothetical protein [Georgenia subflava]
MTPRRASLRPVAVLTAALAAVAGAVVPAGLAAPAAATTDDPTAEETGLEVEITDVGSPVLGPDRPLTIRGTVTNPTDEAVETADLRLRMQRYTPISRSALQRWLEPDSYSTTVLLAREDLPAALPAGESTTFSVTVEDVPLASAHYAWGPHGVEVEIRDAADAEVEGADRSILLWYPDLEVERTPVSLLVPLAPNLAERATSVADGRPVAEVAAPRLLELLSATDQPGVTTVVDGMLLAPPAGRPGAELGADAATGSEAVEDPTDPTAPTDDTSDGATDTSTDGAVDEATAEPGATGTAGADATATEDGTEAGSDPAGGEPTDAPAPEPTDEPPPSGGAADLVASVTDRADATDREIRLLPWADADVAALAHTGADVLLAEQRDRSTAAGHALGLASGTALTWPDTDRPDQVTMEAVARAGADAVVLPAGAATPLQELTYTAAGRADLQLADGTTLPAVLADEQASAVLSGRLLPRAGTDGDVLDLDPLDARQLLLAETAVISRERPADPRAVVLALPRDFAGDPTALADMLAALMAAPWVTPTTVSDVLATEAPALERGTLPDIEVAAGELDNAVLRAMDAVVAEAASFASITTVPDEIVEPVERAVEQVLSSAWREDPGAREDLIAAVRADVEALDTQVTALPSSTLNLINSSADLPVHVRNDLDTDVTVQVRLDPTDQRLQAPDAVTLTVPAGSQATAQVPVRAVGSGDVPVEVELLTADGREVGTSTDLQVRVRADWETVGTAVAAGLLGVLLVVGLVRTVRRGPRMDPDEVVPDPEEAP